MDHRHHQHPGARSETYDTARWFTPPPFEIKQEIDPPSPTSRPKRTQRTQRQLVQDQKEHTEEEAGRHFKSAVRGIKASSRWRQRNASFEGRCYDPQRDKESGDSDGSGSSSDSSGSAPGELHGQYIDVFFDKGAIGWYTAKVISVRQRRGIEGEDSGEDEKEEEESEEESSDDDDDDGTLAARDRCRARRRRRRRKRRNTATTTLLSIKYEDGDIDDEFVLSEWLWSVSSKSTQWLKEHRCERLKKKKGTRKRARVLHSDSDDEGEKEAQDSQVQEEEEEEVSQSHETDEEEEESDGEPTEKEEDSGGVLSYMDAVNYCDYEHDRRCDPLYADVGGRAFHVVNDRWRHAFHHMPNNDFARDVLRICSGPLLPGLSERRKKCKLCVHGTCRRHGRGSGVSGLSGAFPPPGNSSNNNGNARCVMCNRRRNCVHVQLGALSERYMPIGQCCLRKLDSIIVLYRALEGIRALRGSSECASPSSPASSKEAQMQRLEAVRDAVDIFNRAVNAFDDAMGMDMRYERHGPDGAGFYRDYEDSRDTKSKRKRSRPTDWD